MELVWTLATESIILRHVWFLLTQLMITGTKPSLGPGCMFLFIHRWTHFVMGQVVNHDEGYHG